MGKVSQMEKFARDDVAMFFGGTKGGRQGKRFTYVLRPSWRHSGQIDFAGAQHQRDAHEFYIGRLSHTEPLATLAKSD